MRRREALSLRYLLPSFRPRACNSRAATCRASGSEQHPPGKKKDPGGTCRKCPRPHSSSALQSFVHLQQNQNIMPTYQSPCQSPPPAQSWHSWDADQWIHQEKFPRGRCRCAVCASFGRGSVPAQRQGPQAAFDPPRGRSEAYPSGRLGSMDRCQTRTPTASRTGVTSKHMREHGRGSDSRMGNDSTKIILSHQNGDRSGIPSNPAHTDG